MSVLPSVEVSHNPLDFESLIKVLTDYGWVISGFLPLGAEPGDVEKQIVFNGNFEQLFCELKKKQINKEVILVEIQWKNSEVGGSLFIDSKENFHFCPFFNRQVIQEYPRYTDFSWYTSKLLIPLREAGIGVEYIRYEDLG